LADDRSEDEDEEEQVVVEVERQMLVDKGDGKSEVAQVRSGGMPKRRAR